MTAQEFTTAVTAVSSKMHRIAEKIVGREEAHDVVQSTIANVWQRRAGVKDVSAYLLQQVADDARDYVKDRDTATLAFLDREDGRPQQLTEGSLIDRIEVRRVIESLPENIRYAVWTVYAEGASWQEAADDLGIERKTLFERVRKWLPYIRERFDFQNGAASSAVSGETR